MARLWNSTLRPWPGCKVRHRRCSSAAFDPHRWLFATWGGSPGTPIVRLWNMELCGGLGPELLHEGPVESQDRRLMTVLKLLRPGRSRAQWPYPLPRLTFDAVPLFARAIGQAAPDVKSRRLPCRRLMPSG